MADGHTTTTDLAKPFQAEAEKVVAKQAEARARHPNTGVCWSGMTTPAPVVEDIEVVRQRLVREADERNAFWASPRGRFLKAVAALREDHPQAAYELRRQYEHFYFSGFGRPGERVQVDAIGRALKVLAPLDCQDAQAAEDALADLLIADAAQAEAA